MQTARRLDPQLRADIERLAERLVPPATNEAAEALAGAGELLLDLLRAKPPRTPAEAAASIRAASRIGGQAALRLISDILARPRRAVRLPGRRRNNKRLALLQAGHIRKRSPGPIMAAGKELQVPDFASMETLHAFPALRAVRCELNALTQQQQRASHHLYP